MYSKYNDFQETSHKKNQNNTENKKNYPDKMSKISLKNYLRKN